MKSSLEIAQEAELRADRADRRAASASSPTRSSPTGATRRKVSLDAIDRLADRPDGKLVCVAGMTPTKAGEGKTTTSVGADPGDGP